MKNYIGCDANSHYSVFVSVDDTGRIGAPVRVNHNTRELRVDLKTLEPGTPVAVEASGGCAANTKPTNWMPKVWRSFVATAHCG